MNKNTMVIVVAIGIFVITAGVLYGQKAVVEKESVVTLTTEAEPEETFCKTSEPMKKEIMKIYVHICGSVVKPGVYQMEKEDRVFDLIEKAKGLTDEASADSINQAEIIEDGERIYIPSKKEAASLQQDIVLGVNEETKQDGKVNINKADLEMLMTIPGIGEAKAKSIMTYREEKGRFQSIEDIKKIEGIKDGVFNKIKEFIVVS